MKPYKRISYEERIKMETYLSLGKMKSEIAELLNRSKSSIGREKKNNSGIVYKAELADVYSKQKNKTKHVGNKIKRNSLLEYYIHLRLRQRWSPAEISQRLKSKYLKERNMQVSHESIYTYIYTIAKGALRKELIGCLFQQKKKRMKPRAKGELKTKIPDRIDISKRPPEVEDRLIPGHWESDLIIGKNIKSAIGTLVERTSRKVLMVKLENKKASTVRKGFTEAMKSIPEHMRVSITHDNGTEMAEHKLFTQETKIDVYFAHPYRSCERGTNENTNGLIRAFFPKGTDFNTVSSGKLKEVEDLLNNRPRKCLGWRTPNEVFDGYLLKKCG